MSVTVAQATTLLENILFESPTLAATNATGYAALSELNPAYSTVAGLASAIASSPEASIADLVVRYYEAALGRSPGGSEVAYYVAIAETGLTPTQISQGTAAVPLSTLNTIAGDFANSPEFAFASAGTNVVELLYLNILGRSPSAVEIAYYENQLSSGFTTTNLIQEFANSPEYIAKVGGSIQTNLTNYGTAVTGGTTPTTIGTITTTTTSTTFTLTTGQDTQTANVFYGTLGSTGATLQSIDVLTGTAGGTANTLNISDATTNATGYITLPVGITLSNIQDITVTTSNNVGSSSGAVAFDVSAISGLTQLTVTSVGTLGDDITAAATTSVTDTSYDTTTQGVTLSGGLNDSITTTDGQVSVTGAAGTVSITAGGVGTSAISVDGGTVVSITANKETTGAITVGAATAPTGTVTVVYNDTDTTAAAVTGAISVTGGTIVSVTENLKGSASGVVTAGVITADGTSKTTSVTIAETASSTATTAATLVSGVAAVTAITAAPGVTKVSVVAGVSPVSATSAATGITDGAVTIVDASHAALTTSSNTITSISLSNIGNGNNNVGGNSVIQDNALTTLTLAGKIAGSLTLTNAAAGAATNTTLTLDLNAAKVTNFIDTNAEITTLSVVTGGTAKSTLTAFSDASLTTLKVSGTEAFVLTPAVASYASLSAVTVSGTGGFTGDISGLAATTTGTVTAGSTVFTSTSTGAITLTMDGSTSDYQTFTGSTGTDTITIDVDVKSFAPIAGGSSGSNELILNAALSGFTATKTGTYATGFEILGLDQSSTGTLALGSWATEANYTTLVTTSGDITGTTTSVVSQTVTGFEGTKVIITGTSSSTTHGSNFDALVVDTADTSGATDTMTVTLNGSVAYNQGSASALHTDLTVTALTLSDANSDGIATVNFVSNSAEFNAQNLISTLTDKDLTTLNVSGTGGLDINSFTSDTSTALTINNTETNAAGVTFGTLNDSALGSFTFSGTGATTIDSLITTVSFLTVTNSGTGAVAVESITDNNLTKLTLSAGVALGQGINFSGEASGQTYQGLSDTLATGITVVGSADNAHVTLNLGTTGAGSSGATDTISLGNANNYVSDVNDDGTITLTVGTGSNYIALATGATGATAYTAAITLGTHTSTTGIDEISLGGTGVATGATVASVVITGAVTGDTLIFNLDAAYGNALGVVASGTTATSVTTAIAAAYTAAATAAHDVGYATYGGNTYVVESTTLGQTSTTTTTLVELVGVHTLTAGTAGAFDVVLAS
jgi:hypothetical protein